MKIVSLAVSQFKRISAVYIKPDGALVEISGRNAQGKSSILDAIWAALAGKGVIDARPIRAGQQRATIRLDLGAYVVTRTFKAAEDGEYTTELRVETAEGASVKKPQEGLLDGLIGGLSFDPLEFERAKPDERFAMVRALLPGVDFDGFDKAMQADMDARKDLNREAKEAAARAEAIVADMGLTGDPIDVDALIDAMGTAGTFNAEIETRQRRRAEADAEVKRMRVEARAKGDKAEDLRAQADALDNEAIELVGKADALDEKLANAEPLPEPRDVSTIRADIDKARAHNEALAKRQRRLDAWREAKGAEGRAEALTAAMDARKRALRDQIAAASFPVAGVAFEGREVMLGGVPFAQASDAERLKASVEIAMALNPELKVIRVRDGSRLDADNLALLGKIAEERGFQVWVESVGDGKGGIVIEDGHVRGQDPEALLAAEDMPGTRKARKGAAS